MEFYKKPLIVNIDSVKGVIPAAATGGVAALAGLIKAVAGLSIAGAAAVGAASGLAAGAAKGNNFIDSFHTGTLTTRKDFAME